MKKLLFSLAFLIFCLGSVCAKKKSPKKNPFVGMWQMCYVINAGTDSMEVISTPIFKIYDKDGTYTAIYGYNRRATHDKRLLDTKAAISQLGRYEVKNDSVYHEQIDKHFMAPEMEKSTTILNYKFADEEKNFLILWFKNSVSGVKVNEMWRRLQPIKR